MMVVSLLSLGYNGVAIFRQAAQLTPGGEMKKENLGAKNCLYPTLTTLVGAYVGGKPNYVAIAHVGIADFGSITIGINKKHHTTPGIEGNGAFSVNKPVEEINRCHSNSAD